MRDRIVAPLATRTPSNVTLRPRALYVVSSSSKRSSSTLRQRELRRSSRPLCSGISSNSSKSGASGPSHGDLGGREDPASSDATPVTPLSSRLPHSYAQITPGPFPAPEEIRASHSLKSRNGLRRAISTRSLHPGQPWPADDGSVPIDLTMRSTSFRGVHWAIQEIRTA